MVIVLGNMRRRNEGERARNSTKKKDFIDKNLPFKLIKWFLIKAAEFTCVLAPHSTGVHVKRAQQGHDRVSTVMFSFFVPQCHLLVIMRHYNKTTDYTEESLIDQIFAANLTSLGSSKRLNFHSLSQTI